MDDHDYSPQRATRVAAVASLGTLLTLVGFAAGGGSASGASAVTAAPTTSSTTIDPATTTAPTTTVAPTTTTAPCTNTYTVQSGDYWLLLAQESGVTVDELYARNGAGPDTALFAGGTVCLPEGATVVTTVPATVAPATVAVSATPTTPTTAAAAPVVSAAQTTRASG